MSFDGSELQKLEEVYLSSRNSKDLEPLYSALLIAGKTLLGAYTTKIGIRLSLDRREEVVHDATTRLLEMYLKHPDQQSLPLSSRLYLELVFQLHNPKQIRYDQTKDYNTLKKVPDEQEIKEWEDVSLYTKQIAEDVSVKGKMIIIDLYRFRYYKKAILAIAEYTPKAWIYDHAVELRTIFLHTRGER